MDVLRTRLAVEPGAGADRFLSRPAPGTEHLFGGLVVAHALHAACRTVPAGQPPHSLHASFLARGSTAAPLEHHVERTRDGSSFATRRVEVRQAGRPLLVLTAGFHASEPGEEHQGDAPFEELPDPASLPAGRYDDDVFDSRDVEPTPQDRATHRRRMWGRLRGRPVDGRWASLALAYHADHGPTRAARQPHADHPGVDGRMSVSLDHSVWFLRPATLDGWLLSTFTPVSTAGARGLVHGTIHDRAGRLLVAVTQEVVLRL